jgi:hypothetical protein
MMIVDSSSMVVTVFNKLDVAELLLSDESLPPFIYRLNHVLKHISRFGA